MKQSNTSTRPLPRSVKFIYIPGNGGGGVDVLNPVHQNWVPYIKRELEKLEIASSKTPRNDASRLVGSHTDGKIEVIIQDWPDAELARAKYWLPHLEELGADEKTILIGWSSGAVAAMRYAESHKILGTVLVGACYTDLGIETEKISGYLDEPWDWEKIKSNQEWIVQFASTNDPFIPIEEARHVHKMLDTEYFEMDNQQHFGYPDPKLEFPEIIEILKRKLSSN